jgi:hypothetical protein
MMSNDFRWRGKGQTANMIMSTYKRDNHQFNVIDLNRTRDVGSVQTCGDYEQLHRLRPWTTRLANTEMDSRPLWQSERRNLRVIKRQFSSPAEMVAKKILRYTQRQSSGNPQPANNFERSIVFSRN